jgi:hypothetical protein
MYMQSIDEILQRFRNAAIGNADPDPVKANMNHDIVHSCYKILKETEEGRKAIILLMSDINPHVRSCAAARSLAWEPERARRVLEEIRDSDGSGAFNAKWTLIEYDKGRLTFDY